MEVSMRHFNQAVQSLSYLLLNLTGCILFMPSYFPAITVFHVICVGGATFAILYWASRKPNVDYVEATSSIAIENE